jgi:O-methyltransferase
VIHNSIAGDFIECGVWRGGTSMFARAVFMAYEQRERKVILADSFAGLPPAATSKVCLKIAFSHIYE